VVGDGKWQEKNLSLIKMTSFEKEGRLRGLVIGLEKTVEIIAEFEILVFEQKRQWT
jgi:hypothetical protein